MTQRFRTLKVSLVLALVALMLVGCATHTSTSPPTPPNHAGAVNAFDNAVYDALITIQAGIEKAKTVVSADKKPLLNQVITGYNKAETAYRAYHGLALQGKSTAAQQADLQAQIDKLKADLVAIGSGQ